MKNLIGQEIQVINIGLSSFAENLKQEGVSTVSLNWRPPASGNQSMLTLLDRYRKMLVKN